MYKDQAYMDSGYNGRMTVSDRNGNYPPTPCMDKVCAQVERVVDKMEKKFEEMSKNDPCGLFTRMLLCIVCCARIILGDSDEDVKRLKAYVSDKGLKEGCEKEILASPNKFRDSGLMLS